MLQIRDYRYPSVSFDHNAGFVRRNSRLSRYERKIIGEFTSKSGYRIYDNFWYHVRSLFRQFSGTADACVGRLRTVRKLDSAGNLDHEHSGIRLKRSPLDPFTKPLFWSLEFCDSNNLFDALDEKEQDMRDLSRNLYEVAGDVPSLERSFRRGADEHSLIASWEVAAMGLVERINEVEEPRCLRAVRKRVSLAEVVEAGLVPTIRAGRSALLGALKRAHHEDLQGTTPSPVLARVLTPPLAVHIVSAPKSTRLFLPPPEKFQRNGAQQHDGSDSNRRRSRGRSVRGLWVDGLRVDWLTYDSYSLTHYGTPSTGWAGGGSSAGRR